LIGAALAGGVVFVLSLPSSHSSSSLANVDLVVDGKFTAAGWLNAIRNAASIGLGGAASGLTIWWIAYRKR